MRKLLLLFLVSLIGSVPAFARSVEDLLTVKLINGQQATLEGHPGLKAGDKVYFARSPFQFPVTNVNGDMITITLPTGSDVAVGQTMLRQPTEAIKKAMSTEDKLKKALEE